MKKTRVLMNESQAKKDNLFFQCTIPGEPIAQKRPRLTRGHIYSPQHDLKTNIGYILKRRMNGQEPTTKPTSVKMVFYFKFPQKAHPHCTNKKDLDNIAKFYLDCLNLIVFSDDHNCVHLELTKVYSTAPAVTIQVYEL